MLGIFVVGRLATRYGVKVQLRHSWYGGVTALVLFPENLVVRPTGVAAPLLPSPEGMVAPAQLGSDGISSLGELPPPPLPPVDRSQLDSLPIFEAARSDWFEIAPDGSHLPLRRHATQLGPPVADEQTALPRGSEQPALDGRPAAWPEANRPAAPDAVEEESDFGEPTGTPPPGHDIGAVRESLAEAPVTRAGLPRRIPRANLAPEMLSSGPPAGESPSPSAGGRTPTEVRSMLASYRSGLERGRSAAATRPSRGEEPEEAGDGTPSSSRSDHDAAQ
jgi:hypothetical protein